MSEPKDRSGNQTAQRQTPEKDRPVASPKQDQPLRSGDDAPAGTPGTGEVVCPECDGRGRINGQRCENCGGTGRVVQAVGGA